MIGLEPRITMNLMKEEEINIADIKNDIAAGPGHPASKMPLGTVSEDRVAVSGEDGYLFIENGSNNWEEQYLGIQVIENNLVSKWIDVFENRQKSALERGVSLINLIIPEKQVVYYRKRWPQQVQLGEERLMRKILHSANQSCRLIYPERILSDASNTLPVYFRHDSHWTASGCVSVMNQVVKEIDPRFQNKDGKFSAGQHEGIGDLVPHCITPPPSENILSLGPNGELVSEVRMYEISGSFRGSEYVLQNDNAPYKKNVIVFGDSYSHTGGVSYYLSSLFSRVCFRWSKDIDWIFIEKNSADIVVWEHSERFMTEVANI